MTPLQTVLLILVIFWLCGGLGWYHFGRPGGTYGGGGLLIVLLVILLLMFR